MSIDAGHVRTARGHQGRTFEVMAAQVSNDDGKPVLFSGVPGEADQQHAQLNGVLSGLGMTADTEVTILSDGADGPRSPGEAASTGTVFHVLNWFQLAMRNSPRRAMRQRLADQHRQRLRTRARFADAVEHIRWRLWNGRTNGAPPDPGILAAVKAKAEQTAAARSAAKLTKALIALETYVSNLADLIIDYASVRKRLSDELVLHVADEARRAVAAASPDGGAPAKCGGRRVVLTFMLQVRTAIVNGTFDADHRDICRRHRSFRMAA